MADLHDRATLVTRTRCRLADVFEIRVREKDARHAQLTLLGFDLGCVYERTETPFRLGKGVLWGAYQITNVVCVLGKDEDERVDELGDRTAKGKGECDDAGPERFDVCGPGLVEEVC